MKNVMYLCRGDSGYLFPDELPDDDYMPGVLVIEGDSTTLDSSYSFRAQHKGKEILLQLNRVAGSDTLFSVDVPDIGRFNFQVDRGQLIPYAGSRLPQGVLCVQIVPTQMSALESACIDHDFYFVGQG